MNILKALKFFVALAFTLYLLTACARAVRTFEVSDRYPRKGEAVTLRWETNEVTEVRLDGESVSRSGSKTVRPQTTKTYTLSVQTDKGKTRTKRLTVYVGYPLIQFFEVHPTRIRKGEEVTLRWDVDDADTVELRPIGHMPQAQSTWSVTPKETTTYVLVARNTEGERQKELKVEVEIPTPQIHFFEVFPAGPIRRRQSVTLRWETSDATKVELHPIGPVALSGSLRVRPGESTRYMLDAKNEDDKSVTQEIIVVVQ